MQSEEGELSFLAFSLYSRYLFDFSGRGRSNNAVCVPDIHMSIIRPTYDALTISSKGRSYLGVPV